MGPSFTGQTWGREPKGGGAVWLGKEDRSCPPGAAGQHLSLRLQSTGSATTPDKGERLWAGNAPVWLGLMVQRSWPFSQVEAWMEALPSGGRLL